MQLIEEYVFHSWELEKNFSQAIGECLWITIELLAERAALVDKDLFSPIHSAMDEVKANYQSQIDGFDFSGILPNLLG